MVRRRNESEHQGKPEVLPAIGIDLLKKQIANGNELLNTRPMSKDAYSKWKLVTRNYLEKTFGVNSTNVSNVTDVVQHSSFPRNAGEQWWEKNRVDSLTTQITRLEGLIELLNTEQEIQRNVVISKTQPATERHRIFLVHGHDDAALQQLARFLEKLDQEIVILREQANRGQTIIEKFEDYSDVGFAVVLLTPDDKGGSIAVSTEEHLPRARQNVIFELGFFLGKLGRSHVCVLYSKGVDIPSDYSGVLYVELDKEGGWKLRLAKELKTVGFSIDMNKAF
jgi:predicted nucleotide-binding protein